MKIESMLKSLTSFFSNSDISVLSKRKIAEIIEHSLSSKTDKGKYLLYIEALKNVSEINPDKNQKKIDDFKNENKNKTE